MKRQIINAGYFKDIKLRNRKHQKMIHKHLKVKQLTEA